MHRKSFQKFGHINCKIIAFEVKKRAFLHHTKQWSANFGSSWLKTFVLCKLEAFDIVLGY
jgi:hypothetical protein